MLAQTLFALAASMLVPSCEAASKIQFQNATSIQSNGGFAECISGTLAIPIEAENTEIKWEGPKNSMEMTQFFQDLRSIDSSVAQRMVGGKTKVKGTYDIYARLCFPPGTAKSDIKAVQVLTHGGTLDWSYWDMAEKYSYVDAAAKAGYATLAYDRLGVGLSEHPDPIQVVQANVHVEIIHGLAKALREGLEGHSFDKIVGQGHSFGTWYTQGAASKYPEDFDALVVTGTSDYFDIAPVVHSSLQFQMASNCRSGNFKDLASGYLVMTDLPHVYQFNLYYYPHFDEEVMLLQQEARQPVTVGELFTLGNLFVPTTWSGPLDIVNGEKDFVYCAGNCLYNGDQTAKVASSFFPKVGKKFSSFNLPNTGHNIPGHYRAQEAYDHIFNFLKSNGIEGKADAHSEL